MNTNKIDLIKAEVEKRYKDWKEKESNSHSIESEIRMSECQHLLLMLDSMQEDPVSKDLEEACEQLSEDARKHKAETSSPFFSQTDYKQGVIDGAKWQKEKMMTKAIDGIARPDDSEIWCNLASSNLKDGDEVKVIIIKED